jgi:hypothetical protein
MKITIESTSKIVELEIPGQGCVPARVWQGETDSGIPVACYVTRISPLIPKDDVLNDQFARELTEVREPLPIIRDTIPLRLII